MVELLKEAEDGLRVLRLHVPKWEVPEWVFAEPKDAESSPGRTRYVVVDGKVVEGSVAARSGSTVKNWSEGNIDPDSLARHNHLMRRMQFRDRPGGPPAGPVWD